MKCFNWGCLILLISLSILLGSCRESKVLHNKKVMVLGNSITQDGRYVDFIEYYLRINYPEDKLDIVSIGLSSETVNGQTEKGHPWLRPCIHSRLYKALEVIQPDLVLSCYGMNDGLFSNLADSLFETYKSGTELLKKKVEASGASLILVTPTVFDPDPISQRLSYDGEEHSYRAPYYHYNNVLKKYAEWLLLLKDVQVIDLHHYLDDVQVEMKQGETDTTFVPDGVHPNLAGHFLMAKKILKDLYPVLDIPEPYPTLNELNEQELFQIVSKRRKLRSKGWRDYIGYTRGKTVKSNNIEETITEVKLLDEKITSILR